LGGCNVVVTAVMCMCWTWHKWWASCASWTPNSSPSFVWLGLCHSDSSESKRWGNGRKVTCKPATVEPLIKDPLREGQPLLKGHHSCPFP
jgi:hypothetical protein